MSPSSNSPIAARFFSSLFLPISLTCSVLSPYRSSTSKTTPIKSPGNPFPKISLMSSRCNHLSFLYVRRLNSRATVVAF